MANKELIYGLHAVQSLLENNAHAVCRIWLQDGRRDKRLNQLLEQLREQDVQVQVQSRRALDDLVDGRRHQGVVAEVLLPEPATEQGLEGLLETLDEPPFLLILDGVQDPHNLGACLRSAAAAGVHAVIIPKDRAVGLTSVVRKVASGAAEVVPLYLVSNLARTLRQLQERGIWLYGAAGEADKSVYQVDLKGSIAIVMGGEGKGLRRLTREHCDVLMHIPMTTAVESLNVSVAAGVLLFEANRQRLP
ncbi:MAG: 23S rRNA (guanosine(2251)-2'-O)-methyltransferase RlmB [Gammaproteobacteria bacterium]|nr:23S rRNA (guanosine(2251)-2'-O)-methyltransferase RlmB [Gammaproteobacteria bacterium]